MPSVAILRHRDTRLDRITKLRYHRLLAAIVEGTVAPSDKEEETDPIATDATYAAWSAYLRTHTRDRNRFPLISAELTSYGYRRNLWGLRGVAIAVSSMSLAALSVWCWWAFRRTGIVAPGLTWAWIIDAVLLLLWLFQFTTAWVRVPADAYAERLVEATDAIAGVGSTSAPGRIGTA